MAFRVGKEMLKKVVINLEQNNHMPSGFMMRRSLLTNVQGNGLFSYVLETHYRKMDTGIGLSWKAKMSTNSKVLEEKKNVACLTPEQEAQILDAYNQVRLTDLKIHKQLGLPVDESKFRPLESLKPKEGGTSSKFWLDLDD